MEINLKTNQDWWMECNSILFYLYGFSAAYFLEYQPQIRTHT